MYASKYTRKQASNNKFKNCINWRRSGFDSPPCVKVRASCCLLLKGYSCACVLARACVCLDSRGLQPVIPPLSRVGRR